MISVREKPKKIYILREKHPINLEEMANLRAVLSLMKLERSERSSYENSEKIVEILKEFDKMYEDAETIRRRELEYLKILTQGLEDRCKIYTEGDKKALEEGRPEILKFARETGIELVPLDEGNKLYEEYNKKVSQLFEFISNISRGINEQESTKSIRDIFEEFKQIEYKMQKERESHWAGKIRETMGESEVAIVIVGAAHVGRNKNKNNEYMGYFDEILRKMGYEVEVVATIIP